jgi:hypothetical protein
MTEESTQYVTQYKSHEGCILKTENNTLETNEITLSFHSSKKFTPQDYFKLEIEERGVFEYDMQCVNTKIKKTMRTRTKANGDDEKYWAYEYTQKFTMYNDADEEEYSGGKFNKITLEITNDFEKYENAQIISISLEHQGKQQTLDEFDLIKTVKDSDIKIEEQ